MGPRCWLQPGSTDDGGTVKNTAGTEVGVALYGSKATLRDASIYSGGAEGMIVGTNSDRGSAVEVFDSEVTGATDGIVLSGSSTLALHNTQVSGAIAGLRAYDGQLTTQGGRIYGGTNGMWRIACYGGEPSVLPQPD